MSQVKVCPFVTLNTVIDGVKVLRPT